MGHDVPHFAVLPLYSTTTSQYHHFAFQHFAPYYHHLHRLNYDALLLLVRLQDCRGDFRLVSEKLPLAKANC